MRVSLLLVLQQALSSWEQLLSLLWLLFSQSHFSSSTHFIVEAWASAYFSKRQSSCRVGSIVLASQAWRLLLFKPDGRRKEPRTGTGRPWSINVEPSHLLPFQAATAVIRGSFMGGAEPCGDRVPGFLELLEHTSSNDRVCKVIICFPEDAKLLML